MNKEDFYDEFEPPPGSSEGYQAWEQPEGASWLDTLRQLWHWNDLAAEIGQESQAVYDSVKVSHLAPATAD